jgi:hypothetical protein
MLRQLQPYSCAIALEELIDRAIVREAAEAVLLIGLDGKRIGEREGYGNIKVINLSVEESERVTWQKRKSSKTTEATGTQSRWLTVNTADTKPAQFQQGEVS